MGAELFQVDRQKDGWPDMMKLVVTFHNFMNAFRKRGKGRQTEPQPEMSSVAKFRRNSGVIQHTKVVY